MSRLRLRVGSVLAQEPSTNLADTWVIHPKVGQEEQFEEAFQKHLAVRKEKGETRTWNTWIPVTVAYII